MNQTTKPAACPDSVRVERIQISHGQAIRVVSVFRKTEVRQWKKNSGFWPRWNFSEKSRHRARLLAPLGVLCAHNALSGLT